MDLPNIGSKSAGMASKRKTIPPSKGPHPNVFSTKLTNVCTKVSM